tara:strand:+ start:1368 stop:1742 length:375 start_codon:yes stop_codon:yes gene_type:complete
MKFRKLLSYKLENDSTLEYSTTATGMGRVQINGETVSEKRGIANEEHSFDYNNSSYVLSLSPLFSIYSFGFTFELIRDDVQLFLCGEKKKNSTISGIFKFVIIMVLFGGIGALIGYGIASFLIK